MATMTPRRSSRIPHNHTPKMSERKKGLFVNEGVPSRESLTEHRKLPVVESESDSEDCDLGIISTLDSSSCDESDQNAPKTPESNFWYVTRRQTRSLLRETRDIKSFMKSPFTLKKYQTRYSCPDAKFSVSTPVTPHLNNHPETPSSTHSCASAHTTSSTSSRARKSLASLIADTESCSSSLKDLNFHTDSSSDSKENTPTKSVRRSSRNPKLTPKFQSFKGILVEQKKNASPIKLISPMKTAVVCLTKIDVNSVLSPTQMLKTPQNNTESFNSPPKIGHNRRTVVEIQESPDSVCSNERNKRLRNDSLTEYGPSTKYPRLENGPKARLSLFNSDRLKEILSTKSFYGKRNPELNTTITAKISSAIELTSSSKSLRRTHSRRRKRLPGQINLGVKHRIRKPKLGKNKIARYNNSGNYSVTNNTSISDISMTVTDKTVVDPNSSQELENEKTDPFGKEKQTIEDLLSQWTDDEVSEAEFPLTTPTTELPCFNNAVIEETSQIFAPVTAIPVASTSLPQEPGAVIIELGADNTPQPETAVPQDLTEPPIMTSSPHATALPQCETPVHGTLSPKSSPIVMSHDVVMADPAGHVDVHGAMPKSGQFLPIEGGYILVEENATPAPVQENLQDLDEIERELKMLDEQIAKMAESNNINPETVLASTEDCTPTNNVAPVTTEEADSEKGQKFFPIFDKPDPGVRTPTSKGTSQKASKRCLLKNAGDQYVIDAGQKKFGATQCVQCGTIYQIGDPQDEHDHLVHHNATDVLRFNGWKEECVVESWCTGRIIRVRGGEAGWRRVLVLLQRVVHPQLGFADALPGDTHHKYTAYLCVEKKQIVGCLIVEPKVRAHRFIPGDPDCCSVEDYPVKCGVSRIWTHVNHRRRGVASRMLDCARASFLYGEALERTDISFSAPTHSGKAFAAKYCGTDNFCLYLQ